MPVYLKTIKIVNLLTNMLLGFEFLVVSSVVELITNFRSLLEDKEDGHHQADKGSQVVPA